LAYTEKVLEHYENPRNVGSFDKPDPHVGTGLVGAPACGDVMKLQLKINAAGVIEDAKFKTFGCGSALASSSLATEWVKGMTVDQAHPDRRGAEPAPGQDPLLGAGRGRLQGRHRRLQGQARKDDGQGGLIMAVEVTERAVNEIKKASSTRANKPKGQREDIRGG